MATPSKPRTTSAKPTPLGTADTPPKRAGAPKPVATPAVATARKPVARKPTAKRNSLPPLSAEQRRGYVEIAAYYIAERRNFAGGHPQDDWAQAEAEIDRLLREGILNP